MPRTIKTGTPYQDPGLMLEQAMRERHPFRVAVFERPEESSWLQILWSTGPIP